MSFVAQNKIVSITEFLHRKIFGHEMGDEMRKFVGNLGWMALGTGISMFLLFFVNLAAARLLGPSEYGKYALIIAVGQLFIIPMLLGFNTASIKYIAESPDKKNLAATVLYSVIFFAIVSSILLFLFKGRLVPLAKIDNAMYIVAVIYGFALAIKYIYEALLRGTHKFKLASFLDVLNSLIVAVVLFGYLFFIREYTFQSYIVAIIAGLVFYVILSFFKTRDKVKGQGFETADFRKMIKYGGYATLGSIGGFVIGNANQFVLNNYLGFSAVGLFAVYSSASIFLTGQLTNIFVNVFFPTVSAIRDKKIIVKKIKRLFLISLIPLLLINSVVVGIIVKLYGNKYEFNAAYIFAFALLGVILLFQNILWWLVASYGKRGIRFTSILGTVVGLLNILALIYLVKNFGIIGSVFASLLVGFVLIFLSFIYFKKNEVD